MVSTQQKGSVSCGIPSNILIHPVPSFIEPTQTNRDYEGRSRAIGALSLLCVGSFGTLDFLSHHPFQG